MGKSKKNKGKDNRRGADQYAQGKATRPVENRKKLILLDQPRKDIEDFIAMCDTEIGGFGYVTINDDGDFVVDHAFLAKQTVTGGSVDFLDEGLEWAINKAATEDRLLDMLFCWHSHVDFAAHWSGIDETMIAGMNNGMTPYLVSLVQNQRGEHEARVDYFNPEGPIGKHTTQVTFKLDLWHGEKPPVVIPEHIQKQYDEQVTVRKATNMALTAGFTGGMDWGNGSAGEGIGHGFHADGTIKGWIPDDWQHGFNVKVIDKGTTTQHNIAEPRIKYLLDKLAEKGFDNLSKHEKGQVVVIDAVKKLSDDSKKAWNISDTVDPPPIKGMTEDDRDVMELMEFLGFVTVQDSERAITGFLDPGSNTRISWEQARKDAAEFKEKPPVNADRN